MNSVLESRLRNFGIAVETGVSRAELAGDQITGAWLPTPRVIGPAPARPIAVELLNSARIWANHAEIALKFTKKYGPLTVPCCPGSIFQFSIQEWKTGVGQLQQTWNRIATANRKAPPINLVGYSLGDYFSVTSEQITLRTPRLDTFATFEIVRVPSPLLRICANVRRLETMQRSDFCRTPNFIASDRRERYCSEKCAQAAQRRAKLEWWNENRRGKQNGTQKAR